MFGLLDKPSMEQTVYPVRHMENYQTTTKGVMNIEKMMLDPSKQTFIDGEHFGVDSNFLKVSTISKRRTYIGSFVYSTSDQVGTQLWKIPVGPMWYSSKDINLNNKYTFDIDTVSYCAKGMTHWRGGIEYTFDCVTSAFDEGVLDITYHPLYQAPATYDEGVSQYFTSMQIRNSKSNVYSVICPYLGLTPYRQVSSKLYDLYDPNQPIDTYFNGELAVWVSSPLRAQKTVSSTIEILVYMNACDDFTVANPGFSNATWETQAQTRGIQKATKNSGTEPQPLITAPASIIEENSETVEPEVKEEDIDTGNKGEEGTFDEGSSNVTSQQGTHIVVQDQYQIVPGTHQKISFTNSRRIRHLADQAWNLEAQLSRFQLIETLDWSITATPNDTIKNYNIPIDMLVSTLASTPFTHYDAWCCKYIDIKFVVVGSRYHQGRLMCAYLPLSKENYSKWGLRKLSTLNNVTLDASIGQSATIRMPFIHPQGYLRLFKTGGDFMGTIIIRVLSQLMATADSSPTIQIKVYASISDSVFKIPRSQPKTTLRSLVEKAFKNSGTEPITLAANRAKVSDPKVHHFTEVVTDFKELMKRNIVVDAIENFKDLDFQRPVDIFQIAPQANWYLSTMALYRGNFVIRVESLVTENNNLPAEGIMSFTHSAAPAPIEDTTAFGSNYAARVLYNTSKVLELELPYAGNFASEYVEKDAINTIPSNNMRFIPPPAGGQCSCVVGMRIADETAFGVYVGLPTVTINDSFPTYDQWIKKKN